MASGTRAYQLALYVVFESPLQMMADNPVYYYREHPCTEFIASVPTTWDELRVLRARCGEQVVMGAPQGRPVVHRGALPTTSPIPPRSRSISCLPGAVIR